VFLGLLAFSGCAGGKNPVTGNVTFDGTPVADGDITFESTDPGGVSEGGKIKDGKYTVHAKPGNYKVKITAVREIPGKKGPMGFEPATEDYIPTKYNASTELKAEVGKGKDQFDFTLTSK